MKRLFLVSAMLATSASGAYAADLVIDEPALEAAMAPASDWSGGYIGLQVGAAFGAFDDTFPPNPPAETDGELSGGFLGVYGGANMQVDGVVFGIDADLNYAGIEGTEPNITGIEEMRIGIDWTGAVRGRVGIAADSLLLYAAGGLAVANAHLELESIGAPPPFATADGLLVGWTVGLGAEAQFAENWIGRVEYRYSDYGALDYTVPGPPRDGSVGITTHTIALGLAYKF